TNEGWSLHYATCVAADPRGGVWIGTQYKGLYCWLQGGVRTNYFSDTGLANNFVSALLTTEAGEIWIGSESPDALRHAVQRLQTNEFQTFELPSGSGPVVAMTTDSLDDF